MSVTQAQVAHIAKNLSKLDMDSSELARREGDMNAIIGYIDELAKVSDLSESSREVAGMSLAPDSITPHQATPDDLLRCTSKRVMGRQIVIDGIM